VSPVGKQPAICRMFDAKKRLYELKKTTKKASKQQKPKQDKEVVVGAKIAVSGSAASLGSILRTTSLTVLFCFCDCSTHCSRTT